MNIGEYLIRDFKYFVERNLVRLAMFQLRTGIITIQKKRKKKKEKLLLYFIYHAYRNRCSLLFIILYTKRSATVLFIIITNH